LIDRWGFERGCFGEQRALVLRIEQRSKGVNFD